MGGKTKQPRVKNNAKPSNSARSAELFGNTLPTFVGFSTPADLGLLSFTPGFNENGIDPSDSYLDPQLQVIVRKMSKKDPITKVKALQEFKDLLKTYDVETVKKILPIWPKLYQNLAIDVDHRVRESVQDAMNIVALKSKKLMAPYIKQLVAIWLASQFDNYAPAASIASSSFNATFPSKEKVRDVCIFCQNEIVDHIVRNLTYHTATTLSSTKTCTPEEAEQKYQRVVTCSLKTLSFFFKVTSESDITKVQDTFEEMLNSGKYWSLAKSKAADVKAAWFEVLCYMLQNLILALTLSKIQTKIIPACFLSIDDSQPLVAPHVWGCILLVQSQFENWHESVSVKKAVIPKLLSYLRNGCNGNAYSVCVNLLPFLSKLTQDNLKEMKLYDFYGQFFDDLKLALTTLQNISKSDYSALTTAYFECLRYIMQKINSDFKEPSNEVDKEAIKEFAFRLLNENIISLLKWCLKNEGIGVKYIIQHTSTTISFWVEHENSTKLYVELLNVFWDNVKSFILAGLTNEENNDIFFNHVIELSEKLYYASPKLESQKVKFAVKLNNADGLETATSQDLTRENESVEISEIQKAKKLYNKSTAAFIESYLKELLIELVRMCLLKSTSEFKYMFKVHKLASMFNDADFYARISEEKTIMGTLTMFLKVMENIDDKACDDAIDITFELLTFLTKKEKFTFIEENLFKIPHPSIQNCIMNRLLSHPLNTEPEVRNMLSHPYARHIVKRLAEDVIRDDSKESLNLLRKCFFQNDLGTIPIDSETVDEVLKIICKPLTKENQMEHLMDECGSFIAQIMPVICSGENCSVRTQQEIFLKLFALSIEHMPNDFISEDTLWEISTCWQDALSSQDIKVDSHIIKECKQIVAKKMKNETISIEEIELIAESISQFIICSTEHICEENARFCQIELTKEEFFKLCDDKTIQIQEFCLFIEMLEGKVSAGSDLHNKCMENLEMIIDFRQKLLNTCIVYNLVCKWEKLPKNSSEATNRDKCTEISNDLNKWFETFHAETIRCIDMAAVGNSLLKIIETEPLLEVVILQLSVKIEMLLREGPEDFEQRIKDSLFELVAKEETISAPRSLLQLVHISQYAQFEENASILLLEDLSEFLVSRNSLKAYVNVLQYLLPHLSSKVISTQMPIMKTNPSVLWIKAGVFTCLIKNNFNSDYNEKSDENIIAHALQFLSEVSEKQHANRELLLYNVDIEGVSFESVVNTVEFMNVLKEVINNFPYELTIKNWDAIRIGLSSWVLSVSKSMDHLESAQVGFFTASVFRLYESLINFIEAEKHKSSTLFIQSIIDEWENLFDKEVNLVLFKTYHKLVEAQELATHISISYNKLLEVITPGLHLLNFGIIFNFYRTSTKITSDHVFQFLLKNLSNSLHCVRTFCVHAVKNITKFYVELDAATYDKKSECLSSNVEIDNWHFLNKFEDYIGRYSIPICKYIDEFNFKLTEIAELKQIDRNEGLSYLFLWDCIIYACANSPITLRSLYTTWLHENRYEEKLLHFLFRAMPVEILKNHDSKIMLTDAFKGLTWEYIQDQNLAVEKYACHLYTEVLRKLPAAVRKWWNTCPSRQKTFVDKLTSNFVSPIICSEELKAISNKKDKHANMQVTVHTSTREVLAVYSIDEVRMELVITLAQNYPLGSVKVEIGKQIGGRLSSRNTGMQLTIFLTHQNGSIYDGLTLWKNNLDKKFEGVEECYVCYTVIHQDTCQLPKLTCKTCRKKFHGPCLYKWFTTSSKSTCPICRNVF